MAEPVTAPMLGKVLRLVARPGGRVGEDETVLVLETKRVALPRRKHDVMPV